VAGKRRARAARQRSDSKSKWIVLVLMGADNPPSQTDLLKFARGDIKEMEQALARGKSRRHLEIAIQLHRKGGITRRRLPGPQLEVPDELGEAVDGTPLFEFVRWALPATNYRPGDRVMLVLWGHAHKFAIGAQPVEGGEDALDFAELVDVLSRLKQPQAGERTATLDCFDIIAFDACDTSTLEMAHQLYPFTRYLLASQIRMPLPGFPYGRILERLAVPKGRLMGPAEFGRWAVRRFCEFYSVKPDDKDTVSLTLLDVQQSPAVTEAAGRLAAVLGDRISDRSEDLEFVKQAFRRSRTIDRVNPASRLKPFVDLADLCLNLLLGCASDDVREAARALGDKLLSPAPVPGGESETGTGYPFVVEHGRNACTTARLNGVSVYAPHVAGSAADFDTMNDRYQNFRFAQETLWAALVTTMAES
jgi:cysteine peptidase C11 family protein